MLGKHTDAIDSCDRAIALEESSVEALLYKGFILRKIRRDTDAIMVYDRVLALNPADDHGVRQQLKRIKGGA
jgi:cytochrome c-type biogenesis protein CcmH/NrfG